MKIACLLSPLLVLALACGPAAGPGGGEAPTGETPTGEPAAPADTAGAERARPRPPALPETPEEELTYAIAAAHGRQLYADDPAIETGIRVSFGGNVILDGNLLFATDFSGSRLELAAGPVAVWDGRTAWLSPADAEFPQARFHLLTWPYFLAAPMKLDDPGTRIELTGERKLAGATYETARLTFDTGVGDSPDDWYVLYKDPSTDRLAAMAYIVTYGGLSRQQAEAEPHAITYGGFIEIDGVTLPTEWTFWLWSEEEGIYGEPIGAATLTDLRFTEPPPGAFEAPRASRELPLPKPQSGGEADSAPDGGG